MIKYPNTTLEDASEAVTKLFAEIQRAPVDGAKLVETIRQRLRRDAAFSDQDAWRWRESEYPTARNPAADRKLDRPAG